MNSRLIITFKTTETYLSSSYISFSFTILCLCLPKKLAFSFGILSPIIEEFKIDNWFFNFCDLVFHSNNYHCLSIFVSFSFCSRPLPNMLKNSNFHCRFRIWITGLNLLMSKICKMVLELYGFNKQGYGIRILEKSMVYWSIIISIQVKPLIVNIQ